MKNIYFMASLATLLLAGCGKDDGAYKFENSEPGVKAVFSASIDKTADVQKTRAIDQEWAIGDRIGITCTDSYSPEYDQKNFEYSTASTQGTFSATDPFNEIWFLGANTFQVSAYYPYSGKAGIVPNAISVKTSTENQLPESQPKIDFLFASTTASKENPNVDLKFFHKMSRLVVQFKSQEDAQGNPLITDLGVIDCFLMKIKQSGTFSPVTGIAVADATEKVGNNNIRQSATEENGYKLSLILFPQPEVNAQIDAILKNDDNQRGIYYKIPLEKLHLEAGRSYNYTVIAKKDADNKIIMEISQGTITDWEEVPSVEVESTPGKVQTNVEGTDIDDWGEDSDVEVEVKDAQ